MPALLIINYDVTDAERLDAYREPAGVALLGPGKGSPVVVTHDTIDLGEGGGAGATTVILEFPSVESAREAFTSPEYQAVIGERLAATDPKSAIIVPT
ncbi:MAG: DUF1330 domain-containing protein [Acidimicrobiia bacterium]